MKTLTTGEYVQQYGMDNFINLLKMSPQVQAKGPNGFQQIGEAFTSGINQAREGINQGGNAKNPVELFEGSLKLGAGLINAAFSPLAPAVNPTVGKVINYAGDKISDNPTVQKFATSKAGEVTSRVTEDIANLNTIAGAVAGSKTAMKVGKAIPGTVRAGAATTEELASRVTKPLRNAARDVTPTMENIVNHQVSRALDLTQGDIKNINRATGHEVGQFIAEKNLIGANKAATVSKIETFFKQNYDAVRTQIGRVAKIYKQDAVPRYTEALVELKKQVGKVPGLQQSNAEVTALLKKKNVTLADIQRVKELMDDHFSLYKVTGHVREGIAKEGLANIRKDLKVFIEREVKQNAGSDIRELNNNVATTRSILDAVADRSTRGLSRTHLTLSDLSLFTGGSIAGTPLFGAALVIAKKILQSPSVRLRIAQYLDSLSDAQTAAVAEALQTGKVPPELDQIIKKP